ncbi:hypothetical protein GCM10010358_01450 [Streptomyces minutiscleroticus]|uniref:Uncharacterized protein n=1 Tax=Streptomyces minutiscleroticus TaxID=68238 RepID=A0A918N9R3_9ACTN|nr:hypothetical protein GCM10010358_01450 [Streptomyces minutiscleroticus]
MAAAVRAALPALTARGDRAACRTGRPGGAAREGGPGGGADDGHGTVRPLPSRTGATPGEADDGLDAVTAAFAAVRVSAPADGTGEVVGRYDGAAAIPVAVRAPVPADGAGAA